MNISGNVKAVINGRYLVEVEALLWELASKDRLAILRLLSEGRRRLTRVAENVRVTVQEAHRDLSRLVKAGLVSKDAEGYYVLTPFGRYVVTILPSLEFLCEYRDYFLSHDLSGVPENLIYRLGELRGSKYAPDTFTALRYAEILVEEAKEYVWIVTEQVMPSIARLIPEKDIHFRAVMPRVKPPPGIDTRELGNVEVRFLDKVRVALVLNEKRACLAFPRLDGEIDYRGFLVKGEAGHRWCRDLFQHYWSIGEVI